MYSKIVIIGILLALVYYELTKLSPGGIVVPAYLALSLSEPFRIVYTLTIVLAVFGLMKLAARYWILFGRRRFVLSILAAFLLDWLITQLGILPWSMSVIGYLVPALMVRDIEHQGLVPTALSCGIVTGATGIAMLFLGAL